MGLVEQKGAYPLPLHPPVAPLSSTTAEGSKTNSRNFQDKIGDQEIRDEAEQFVHLPVLEHLAQPALGGLLFCHCHTRAGTAPEHSPAKGTTCGPGTALTLPG